MAVRGPIRGPIGRRGRQLAAVEVELLTQGPLGLLGLFREDGAAGAAEDELCAEEGGLAFSFGGRGGG